MYFSWGTFLLSWIVLTSGELDVQVQNQAGQQVGPVGLFQIVNGVVNQEFANVKLWISAVVSPGGYLTITTKTDIALIGQYVTEAGMQQTAPYEVTDPVTGGWYILTNDTGVVQIKKVSEPVVQGHLILQISSTMDPSAYFNVTRAGLPVVPESLLQSGKLNSISDIVIPQTRYYLAVLPFPMVMGSDVIIRPDSNYLYAINYVEGRKVTCTLTGILGQWSLSCTQ